MHCYVTSLAGGDPIHIYNLNDDGSLSKIGSVGEGASSPLFIGAHPNGRNLYLADYVKECNGVAGGAVRAYAVDGDNVSYLNSQPAGGTVPCYVSVTRDGKFAGVADYGKGVVAVFAVNEDGSLGEIVSSTQHTGDLVGEEGTKPNAHCFIFSPDERFAFVADLGLDAVVVYRFDKQTGRIEPNDPPYLRTAKKAGPRHLAFHPNHRFLYAMTEYDNTVIAMSFDPRKGSLQIVDVQSALPADYDGKSFGSDIHIHPSGKFLYVANRGHESIAAFAIDAEHGKLSLIGIEAAGGAFPRAFTLDPKGRFAIVPVEKSDKIVTFAIDQDSGALKATGAEIAVEKPSGIRFIP